MEKQIWAAILPFALLTPMVPLNEGISSWEGGEGNDIYHNISIMTYGSAHDFKVNGFHRNCWGEGNDSYILIVYYGPSLLPGKCKIWNESMEKWITGYGGIEIHNFSGWMIYLPGFFQPHIVFVYGECDELTTFHVRWG